MALLDFTFIFYAVLAFLIGSLPCGFIIGKLRGIDIRKSGSGNIGATNAARVLGKSAGIITLFADILKGAISASIGYLEVNQPYYPQSFAVFGAAAIFGHCFSPWLNFKGGKGVATTLGAFLIISPAQVGIAALVFLITYKISGFVSLGSIISAVALPIVIAISSFDSTTILLSFLVSVLVVVRHKDNIKRLISGEEMKIKK